MAKILQTCSLFILFKEMKPGAKICTKIYIKYEYKRIII